MGRHMGQGTEGNSARGAWGVVFPGPVRQIPPPKSHKNRSAPPRSAREALRAERRPWCDDDHHGTSRVFFLGHLEAGKALENGLPFRRALPERGQGTKSKWKGCSAGPPRLPPARAPPAEPKGGPGASYGRREGQGTGREGAKCRPGGGGIRVGGNRRGAGRGWSAAGRWAGAMGRVSRVCRPWGARGAGRARGGVGWGEKVRYDVILIESCILIL